MATPAPTPTLTPSPNPDSSSPSSSSEVLHDLLSPGAVVGIVISIAITTTILAVLCCYCCCRRRRRHSSSQRPHGRRSPVSRLDSETPTSELGLTHEPASMLEMDASGRGVVLEEPPPAYFTLEHADLRVGPRRPPVEMMGAETRRGAGPEAGSGMEAWNGGRVVVSEVDPWTPHEVPATAPSPPTGRNMNLRVDTDAPPVIHVTDENGEEDEGADLSRSITCSTYSVREAALGTVAMPSIVNKDRNRNQGKS